MQLRFADIRKSKEVEVFTRAANGESSGGSWRSLCAFNGEEAKAALLTLRGRFARNASQQRLIDAGLKAVRPPKRAGRRPKGSAELLSLMAKLRIQERQLADIEGRLETLKTERLSLE